MRAFYFIHRDFIIMHVIPWSMNLNLKPFIWVSVRGCFRSSSGRISCYHKRKSEVPSVDHRSSPKQHLQPFNNYSDGSLTLFNCKLLLKTIMYTKYPAMQEVWPLCTLGTVYCSIEWTPFLVPPCKRHLKIHWWQMAYFPIVIFKHFKPCSCILQ